MGDEQSEENTWTTTELKFCCGLFYALTTKLKYCGYAAGKGELTAIAKQHGNGTCLLKPIMVETIKAATGFLQEQCPWEDEFCEGGCTWEWCEHRKHISI